jgi:hypothetical protein
MFYDVLNDPKAPELYGFQGGAIKSDYNDSFVEQYVGYHTNCLSNTRTPGYINTRLDKAGCYAWCYWGQKLVFDSSSSYFLLSHPNLTWISTDRYKIKMISDVLKFRDDAEGIDKWFGRVMYKGLFRVGTINNYFRDTDDMYSTTPKLFVQTEDGLLQFTKGLEVLSCSSDTESSCGKLIIYF